MSQPNIRHNFGPGSERLIAMLERMLLIRRTEEQLGADSRAGELPGNVHLCAGQEAIAVGVCNHLTDNDYVGSTHRGHGHFLAKGGSARSLIAEVHAKSTGACSGLGGSMHVTDLSKGMIGANGIVGGGIGLAAGAALSAQVAGQSQVAVAFFGDGASSQGILPEVFNIAALWKLPLILVCEYNGYSEFSASSTVNAGEIADRARAFGIPTDVIDGNDVEVVWASAAIAIERARKGEGPSFIEAKTYRLRGHLEAEDGFLQAPYRSEDEIDQWRTRDPIPRLVQRLTEMSAISDVDLEVLEAKVAAEVMDALQFANDSNPPEMERVLSSVFVDQRP
ncbi:AcoA Pyruvate/2-oxoglutarate dehydrogenase complex, dehydrogenase (E1) component, eukaryotic type, alpha subunit [Sphingomonadaceae bacterium]